MSGAAQFRRQLRTNEFQGHMRRRLLASTGMSRAHGGPLLVIEQRQVDRPFYVPGGELSRRADVKQGKAPAPVVQGKKVRGRMINRHK